MARLGADVTRYILIAADFDPPTLRQSPGALVTTNFPDRGHLLKIGEKQDTSSHGNDVEAICLDFAPSKLNQ